MLTGGETCVPISGYGNVRMKIFVIGYRNMGESIIVLFLDKERNNEVLYFIVVDSFICRRGKKRINKTDEILRKYGVRDISCLIWTHPHLDHTKGLKHIIQKYCKFNTPIYVSPHFYYKPNDLIKITGKENRWVVDDLYALNRLTKDRVSRPLVSPRKYTNIDQIVLKGFSDSMCVSLDAVAPYSSILDDYVNKDRHDLNPNMVSIAFILSVDDYYFFFGGDTIDEHIDKMNPAYLQKCVFVKIPHHASPTAGHLVALLDPNVLDNVCTTRFGVGRSNLPNISVLNSYTNIAKHVIVTGDNTHNSADYGLVEYEYSFDKGLTTTINLSGNAYEI